MKDLGLKEGQDFALDIHDAKGDLNAVEEAARSLERDRVSMIYAVNTSVAIRVQRATKDISIVFAIGGDPVVAGLVASFANPDGRLTGVHFYTGDLTAKRLSILKAMRPGLRRVVERGALASYGVSYHEVGRVSARYVQQILAGTRPKVLAVESASRVGLALNLKTARALGLTIPNSIRHQADRIIE